MRTKPERLDHDTAGQTFKRFSRREEMEIVEAPYRATFALRLCIRKARPDRICVAIGRVMRRGSNGMDW